jgi:two-component system heavy metal sensor histidine kinase CusS
VFKRRVADGGPRAAGAPAAQGLVSIDVADPGRRLRLGLDADLAERILQPVLENACRYGSSSVSVSLRRENGSVVYEVRDDGPGVAAEEGERIFEPGTRGAAQQQNGSTGAGLGLALARRLARSVDGDVAADPEARGGRFLVRLPTG